MCPFALCVVSVRTELALGHLRYYLRDVPPQSNSLPDSVLELDHTRVLELYQILLTKRPHRSKATVLQNLFTII